MHNCQDLIRIFDQCFYQSYRTRLVGGAEEPLYTPATSKRCAYIYFTRDYFSSALHEIAHWCIAGEQRRQQEDYGYWYRPDGRTAEQQKEFERVEVEPQALEWVLSACCNLRFRVSADNLTGTAGTSEEFKNAVYHQACRFLAGNLLDRPNTFICRLTDFYRQGHLPEPSEFNPELI
ncbi:elongation factor P hydroxylase [Sansalvadorimonas sp. 2012CJ34-2]|uniref:Elongation factor P hydroxylase n=1 Tax=Parendozoicomonas callyspongiae TaxID=2942213 RepID=A0ABT0PI67_9GAMM|nr:elongation factor P hydroxylase [Sansalvadorimonas sp. 2012CJ34-2]MCL6271028.1 elongation factor P hydroxylase [Sansalvadorimonas sp. 2012CJ34-2]